MTANLCRYIDMAKAYHMEISDMGNLLLTTINKNPPHKMIANNLEYLVGLISNCGKY